VDVDGVNASERGPNRTRAIVVRSQPNGIITDQAIRPVTETDRNGLSAVTSSSNWGISSIFRRESHTPARDTKRSSSLAEPAHTLNSSLSMIHLQEPPTVLRSSELHSEQEVMAIAVTKLLLESYYVIVRRNIADMVPKAIMHFLVNRSKRELHNVLIKKLYRDNLLEDLLRETDEVVVKRTRARENLQALQLAYQILDGLPLEAETI
jgi:dynamin 1-like protein